MKRFYESVNFMEPGSPPTRGRELKPFPPGCGLAARVYVAPHAGARVETRTLR